MIDAMGVGWCFTFIALVCAAASPMLWIEMRWGPKWREERKVKMEKAESREKNSSQEGVMDNNNSVRE
jgi:hypothetical protein